MKTKLKVTAISDTHLRHDLLLPKADMIIHAGDATFMGSIRETIEFAEWFGSLNYRHKIFVPGNHDRLFEDDMPLAFSLMHERNEHGKLNILVDNTVNIEGFNFYGSPATPYFCGWAFNYSESELQFKWHGIPDDTDVLITHGPALGILDTTQRGERVGSSSLRNRLSALPNTLAHVFGHIHESAGVQYDSDLGAGMYSINASVVDKNYYLLNDASYFTLTEQDSGVKKFKLHT